MSEIDLNDARARLRSMAAGSETWDLSPNDRSSIGVVLAELARLEHLLENTAPSAPLSGETTRFDAMANYAALLDGRISLAEYGKTSVPAPSAPLIPQSRAEEAPNDFITRSHAEEMVAEERERCAAIARKHAGRRCDQERTPTYVSFICGWTDASQVIEADIRARNTEASRG